jgi:hypothetical protein
VARDLLREADDLGRRLAALGIRAGTSRAPGPSEAVARVPLDPEEVGAAMELIRCLVEGLAELQGRLQAVRNLKERLDRPRPPRVPDR